MPTDAAPASGPRLNRRVLVAQARWRLRAPRLYHRVLVGQGDDLPRAPRLDRRVLQPHAPWHTVRCRTARWPLPPHQWRPAHSASLAAALAAYRSRGSTAASSSQGKKLPPAEPRGLTTAPDSSEPCSTPSGANQGVGRVRPARGARPAALRLLLRSPPLCRARSLRGTTQPRQLLRSRRGTPSVANRHVTRACPNRGAWTAVRKPRLLPPPLRRARS